MGKCPTWRVFSEISQVGVVFNLDLIHLSARTFSSFPGALLFGQSTHHLGRVLDFESRI